MIIRSCVSVDSAVQVERILNEPSWRIVVAYAESLFRLGSDGILKRVGVPVGSGQRDGRGIPTRMVFWESGYQPFGENHALADSLE